MVRRRYPPPIVWRPRAVRNRRQVPAFQSLWSRSRLCHLRKIPRRSSSPGWRRRRPRKSRPASRPIGAPWHWRQLERRRRPSRRGGRGGSCWSASRLPGWPRADELESAASALDAERDVLAHERDALKAAISKASRRSGYSVLPYKGPNGTWRRPIVLECTSGGVNLRPKGPTFTSLELSPLVSPRSSPLVRAIAREMLHVQASDTPDGAAAVPYLVFLVRPNGIRPYYEARTCLEPLGIAFGYELIDQNLVVDIPDFDNVATWDGSVPLDMPVEPAPAPKTNIAMDTGSERGVGVPNGWPLNRGRAGQPAGDKTGNGDGSAPEDFVWPSRGRPIRAGNESGTGGKETAPGGLPGDGDGDGTGSAGQGPGGFRPGTSGLANWGASSRTQRLASTGTPGEGTSPGMSGSSRLGGSGTGTGTGWAQGGGGGTGLMTGGGSGPGRAQGSLSGSRLPSTDGSGLEGTPGGGSGSNTPQRGVSGSRMPTGGGGADSNTSSGVGLGPDSVAAGTGDRPALGKPSATAGSASGASSTVGANVLPDLEPAGEGDLSQPQGSAPGSPAAGSSAIGSGVESQSQKASAGQANASALSPPDSPFGAAGMGGGGPASGLLNGVPQQGRMMPATAGSVGGTAADLGTPSSVIARATAGGSTGTTNSGSAPGDASSQPNQGDQAGTLQGSPGSNGSSGISGSVSSASPSQPGLAVSLPGGLTSASSGSSSGFGMPPYSTSAPPSSSSSAGGMPLDSLSMTSSSPSSPSSSFGQNSSAASNSSTSDDLIFAPPPRQSSPPGSIEVPFEIVVVCRANDILLHPGGYRLTSQALRQQAVNKNSLLAAKSSRWCASARSSTRSFGLNRRSSSWLKRTGAAPSGPRAASFFFPCPTGPCRSRWLERKIRTFSARKRGDGNRQRPGNRGRFNLDGTQYREGRAARPAPGAHRRREAPGVRATGQHRGCRRGDHDLYPVRPQNRSTGCSRGRRRFRGSGGGQH